MGRPREHDEKTREALLAAAEALVEEGGPAALSVRAVADAIGVSTRAVYSTFGSKDGLLNALAQRSFELLRDSISRLPATDDPAGDLVNAAVDVFRPMAIDHPSMFSLAFLRAAPDLEFDERVQRASAEGLMLLRDRIHRLADADLLGGRDEPTVLAQFNAMCQGMASVELRNPDFLEPKPQLAWRDALQTLLNGLRTPVERADSPGRRRSRR
jgi:AcrR family transcriptional regulator